MSDFKHSDCGREACTGSSSELGVEKSTVTVDNYVRKVGMMYSSSRFRCNLCNWEFLEHTQTHIIINELHNAPYKSVRYVILLQLHFLLWI